MKGEVPWHILGVILAILFIVIALIILAKMQGIGGSFVDAAWSILTFQWLFK